MYFLSPMEEKEENTKLDQGQIYELITGDELSWQAIIYDLVRTEQLDPWNIDIGVLADKYVAVIEQIDEANFFASSKVLLACSLLLRLKSEILLNRYIQDLDDSIFGRKEEKRYELERIEIDEDELPTLIPRTPMPRSKKVTLKELMGALNQAIETENRRIKKEIKTKQAEKSALVVMPNTNRIPLKSRIGMIFKRIKEHLKQPQKEHMTFSELAPTRGEKLASFVPVLHLSNDDKVYLKQEKHFEEIYMMLEKIEEMAETEEQREVARELAQEIVEQQREGNTADQ
jgi:segregation and condensation protein A